MSIVATGAGGLLGSALVRAGALGLSRAELDIRDPEAVGKMLDMHAPAALVNAAAQAGVDRAESDSDLTFAVNGEAVGVLALACADRGVRMVHISTDYVLDEPDAALLTESMQPKPGSAYARSKLAGEEAALAHGAVVVRIQWVYRPGHPNFFTKALQWMSEGREVSLVTDQIGIPCYVGSLAPALLRCAEGGGGGLFHLACQGEASAFDWISAAASAAGIPLRAKPISREGLEGAYRPSRSCLSSDRFHETWGIRLPHWRDALLLAMEENPPEEWLRSADP
jgi:dTDP-4-dehydrorhamnose reductase